MIFIHSLIYCTPKNIELIISAKLSRRSLTVKRFVSATISFINGITGIFGFLLFFYFNSMMVTQMAPKLDVIIKKGGCMSI